jgi:hypothetical protein
VEISIEPMIPRIGVIVGSDVDNATKKMAYVALTALCECHLTDIADTPIMLFLIRDQEEPKWHRHLEAMCDLTSPQFGAGWV